MDHRPIDPNVFIFWAELAVGIFDTPFGGRKTTKILGD